LSYILDAFVRSVYKNSSNFAVSGKGFIPKVQKYTSSKDIEYLPNWADDFDKTLEPFIFSDEKKIHFTFAGNVGKVQNLDNIIKAFASLEKNILDRAQLNIIGDGSHLEDLKNLVEENSFTNIVFWGRKQRNKMYKYFKASDFLIVSLVDKPIFSLTVPAKIQTYIAAKKPILAILNGDAAEIIKENCLGYSAEPNDLNAIKKIFVDAINTDSTTITTFTQNCDKLTSTTFNKEKIIDALLKLLTRD